MRPARDREIVRLSGAGAALFSIAGRSEQRPSKRRDEEQDKAAPGDGD
jgi:hypothetical protein